MTEQGKVEGLPSVIAGEKGALWPLSSLTEAERYVFFQEQWAALEPILQEIQQEQPEEWKKVFKVRKNSGQVIN